jgi:hypothetical protein
MVRGIFSYLACVVGVLLFDSLPLCASNVAGLLKAFISAALGELSAAGGEHCIGSLP